MKKLTMLLVLIMLSTSFMVGCSIGSSADQDSVNNDNPPAQGEEVDFNKLVQVRGSDTMVNLGQQWAENFMAAYPQSQIAITGGGSGTGIAAIINGIADIAQSSRAMKKEEMEQAKSNGFELKEIVAGRDGIAIVVHKDNDIDALTMEDLKDIFTGEVTNWSQLGGKDAEITLYSRESNSGTYAFFKEFVLNDEEYAQHSMLMPSTGAIVEGLKQDVNGIGYIGLGYLTDDIKAVPVKITEEDEAFLPSLETINTGDYPVARPLFLYVAGEPEGVVKLYIDFILGPEGQKIVKNTGFIPLN